MLKVLFYSASLLVGLVSADLNASAIRGRVEDRAGRPLASVSIRASSGEQASSGEDGSFRLEAPSATTFTFELSAYAPSTVICRTASCEVRVVLEATGWREEVLVSAVRAPSSLLDSTESVRVFQEEELNRSASTAVDDTLRYAAGFSLFRRTSSRFSNPTTQGASARGLGASGASRMLVQLDGVPLNDPFGGWVQWSAVPFLALDRAEVLRGGASSLYGSGAVAGVVRLDYEREGGLRGELRAGTLDTLVAGVHLAHQGEAYVSADLEHFQTEGYVAINEASRGEIDRPLSSEHDTLLLAAGRSLGPVSLRGRISFFREDRENGTALQRNDTESVTLSGLATVASTAIRVWSTASEYNQTFTSASVDRNSEMLIRLQHVPVDSLGFSAETTMTTRRGQFLVGGEGRSVSVVNQETNRLSGGVTALEAQERTLAVFTRYLHAFSGTTSATITLRGDSWSVLNPVETSRLADREGIVSFANRSELAASPSIGLLHDFGRFSVAISAHQGFRAPSLNELYRGFRVGGVQTEANNRLRPERSQGGEISVRSLFSRGAVRTQLFFTEIDDAVGNITVSSSPSLIRRRRENAGVIESRGLEVEGEYRPWPAWQLSGAAVFIDSRLRESRVPGLTGARVPQVPRFGVSAEARRSFESITAILRGRYQSSQFDDDQNLLALEDFSAFDLSIWKRLHRDWSLALLAENVFDTRIEAARTPLLSFGTPRVMHLALRWER